MSWIQRLVSRFVPRSVAASMEAESRRWMVRCNACGYERSLWELGGIRWKSTRRQWTWTWGRCPNCGKLSWHRVFWREEATPEIETESGERGR